ncbi:MAG: type II toxin-antitoxin system MqsA family antitoxin [Verrucomicrobiota bacterium]|nr:type II toxin-antitoxin system MqsA family antitoxin [Verrucomicrobiota bacterium]
MNTKCNLCGNKNLTIKKVQYIYQHDGKFLIVENVPCEECDYCGERYYKASVIKKIEEDFNNIHYHGVKSKRELHVPVENFSESVLVI